MGEYRLEPGLPRSLRIQLGLTTAIGAMGLIAAFWLRQRAPERLSYLAAGIGIGCLIFLGAALREVRLRPGFLLTVTNEGLTRHLPNRPDRTLATYEIGKVRGGENNRGLIVYGMGDRKSIHIPPGVENFPALAAELSAMGAPPKPFSGMERGNGLWIPAIWLPILLRDLDAPAPIRLGVLVALLALWLVSLVRNPPWKNKRRDNLLAGLFLLVWLAIELGVPAWVPLAFGGLVLAGGIYALGRGFYAAVRKPERSLPTLTGIAIGLLLCAGLSYLVAGNLETVARARGMVGRQAPDMQLVTADGRTVELADYRGQRPVVVGFWTSWCGPCRQEAPILSAWYRQQRGQGVNFEFLAVNDGEDPPEVKSYLAQHSLPYPVILDPSQKARAAFHVGGIPALFVINQAGRIVFAAIGFDAGIGRELTAALRR